MCGYAFIEGPAEPRTIFVSNRTEAGGVSDKDTRCAGGPERKSVLERVILEVLLQFPDAYHAVVAAMREADGLSPGLP